MKVCSRCVIELTAEGRNVIVGGVYRIPNTNQQLFLERYQSIIDKIKLEKKDIIIGTDQNLDYLKIQQHANTAEFPHESFCRSFAYYD